MHFGRCISLPEDEKRQLLGWSSDLFDTENLELIWRPKPAQLVLYEGDEPVSTCGLLKLTVQVALQDLQIGGIGGVVTPLVHQNKGYAGQVLQEAKRIFAQEWMLDAGMLFCRENLVPFYQGRGWQRLDTPVKIFQPSGMMDCPTPVMVCPLTQSWPAGAVTVDSLPW